MSRLERTVYELVFVEEVSIKDAAGALGRSDDYVIRIANTIEDYLEAVFDGHTEYDWIPAQCAELRAFQRDSSDNSLRWG